MSKVLITGGAGFIGSHLVRKLYEQGFEIVVADTMLRGNKIDQSLLSKIKVHTSDVRNEKDMFELSKGCQYIYHFAAVLGVDVVADNPVETMETEVFGLRNVANAAIHHGVEKLIYASTSGIYGHSAIERSMTEHIMVDPRTSYAIAKRYNEIFLQALHEEKGLNSVSLRFFNVYGQKQDNRMVIPRFIEQAKSNKPLSVYGNGMQTRDFTYIDDTVDCCIALTEKIHGCDIYNIANEHEYTILDVAKRVIKQTGSLSTINFIEAPKKRYDYEVERRWGSSEKLFSAIGMKPQTSLEEGLHKILHSESAL
ncbi:MAG: NAD-dependent epimerase/dehydratase family protein [Flavobacteriales bacterium]